MGGTLVVEMSGVWATGGVEVVQPEEKAQSHGGPSTRSHKIKGDRQDMCMPQL